MYRGFYIGIVVLSVLGLMLSFLITPSEREVALMNMEDKNYETAFSKYQKLLKEGDMSVSVVMPLSKLYLQYGEIDKAVDLVEHYVSRNPDSYDARKMLGSLYKFSNQPVDYLRNLEVIYQLAPSKEVLRELSDIYNFNGQYTKQIIVLNDLLYNSEYEAGEKDFIDLAYLYGSLGEYENAINVLKYLIQNNDWQVELEVMELLVSLLIDNNKKEEVLDFITEYQRKNDNLSPIGIAKISEVIRNKNLPKLALRFIRPFIVSGKIDSDLLIEFLYLQLMLNKNNLQTGFESDIDELLLMLVSRDDIKAEQKRNIAYMLVDLGRKQQAEDIFFYLAGRYDDFGPDMEELLFLWGNNLIKQQSEWLKKKVYKSNREDLAKWLEHLNNSKNYYLSIEIAENADQLNIRELSLYLEALVLSGEKKKLAQVLESKISKDQSYAKLKKFTELAIREDLINVAEAGLEKLIRIRPNDLTVVKFFVRLKYFDGNLAMAKDFIEKYLENNEADYELNYYIGEIFWAEKEYGKAHGYFLQSYDQIKKINSLTYQMQIIETNLLVKLDKPEKAIDKFKYLVQKYPNDNHLIADYVGLLMNVGDYEEASKVLNQVK